MGMSKKIDSFVNLFVNNYYCTLLYINYNSCTFALNQKHFTMEYSRYILSSDEVMSIFKITRGTLYNWEKQGKIAFVKVGRRKLYDLNEIRKIVGF